MSEPTYVELLQNLLESEFGKSPERGKELIRVNASIVSSGMIVGKESLRAVALLLDEYHQQNS